MRMRPGNRQHGRASLQASMAIRRMAHSARLMDGEYCMIPSLGLIPRSWVTIREGMVRRLADLGLLTTQDVREVLPDSNFSEPWMPSGESLMVSRL